MKIKKNTILKFIKIAKQSDALLHINLVIFNSPIKIPCFLGKLKVLAVKCLTHVQSGKNLRVKVFIKYKATKSNKDRR